MTVLTTGGWATRRPGATDYLIVGLGIALVVAAVVLPLLLGFAVLRFLWRQISGGA